MATPVRIETVVGEDGVIETRAPELTPGQRMTVTIEAASTPPETTEPAEAPQPEKRHVIDIIAETPGHQLLKTAEEVDAYIKEERDSWDRKRPEPLLDSQRPSHTCVIYPGGWIFTPENL
jgi:hypothetical protein